MTRGPTPLQVWTRTLRDLLLDAREELDGDVYSWFVAIGTELFGLEAARLAVGEALRAKRARSDEKRAA